MSEVISGSCHCGRTTYTAGPFLTPVSHCHCVTCRKTHAAPFASTARVSRNLFSWTSSLSNKRTYESSPGKFRHFCGNCGAHLMAEWPHEDTVILRVATLDGMPQKHTSRHIWCSHDLEWLDYASVDERYPELP